MSKAEMSKEAAMEAFHRQGVVLVTGSLDRELGDGATHQISLAVSGALANGRDYAMLMFDCTGHDAVAIQRFVGAMYFYRPSASFRYVGYVVTLAMAGAFELLQHCDWRVAHPGALLRMEHSELQLDNYDLAELYDNPGQALAYERARIGYVIDMYSRRSGQSAKKIQALMRSHRTLLPSQALELGLLDEIIDVLPTASVRPDYRIIGVMDQA